jgi:hypothetical protein
MICWNCHFSGDDLIFFEERLRMGPKRPRRAAFGCLPAHLLFATPISAMFSRVLKQLRHTE